MYACGSELSLSIKPSLLQLTVLNPGALKQKLLQRVGRSRPGRGAVGWGLCGGGGSGEEGLGGGVHIGWGSGSLVFPLIVGRLAQMSAK